MSNDAAGYAIGFADKEDRENDWGKGGKQLVYLGGKLVVYLDNADKSKIGKVLIDIDRVSSALKKYRSARRRLLQTGLIRRGTSRDAVLKLKVSEFTRES